MDKPSQPAGAAKDLQAKAEAAHVAWVAAVNTGAPTAFIRARADVMDRLYRELSAA